MAGSGFKATLLARLCLVCLLVGLSCCCDKKARASRRALSQIPGLKLVYRLEVPSGKIRTDVLEQTVFVITKRINSLGLKDTKITRIGADRFQMDLSGFSALLKDRVKAIVETVGILDFKLVKKPAGAEEVAHFRGQTQKEKEKVRREMEDVKKKNEQLAAEGKPLIQPEEELHTMVIRDKDGNITERLEVILENKDAVSGRYLSDVYVTEDEMGARAIGFELNPEGAKNFANLTREENRHRELAIILDGVIQLAPTIRETTSKRAIIQGGLTLEEIDRMVAILRSGSLPAKPILEREVTEAPEKPETP